MASDRSPKDKSALILDSTAFYAGIPYTGVAEYYTTSSVIKEISHRTITRTIVESLIESNRLSIINPLKSSVSYVKEEAGKSGDISKLSEADISLIALAVEMKVKGFKVTILSDDYSVENLAKLLKIDHSAVSTRGISRVGRWMVYCSGCGKVFEDRRKIRCDVCGTPLKRRLQHGLSET